MRILVTGSRTWTDHAVIRGALTALWHPGRVLVSGACPRGADALCEACWARWGGRLERYPADWDRDGHRAGYLRNAAMVATAPDVCLAFIRDHSPGASHTARLAQRAGIPTRIYRATTPANPVAFGGLAA